MWEEEAAKESSISRVLGEGGISRGEKWREHEWKGRRRIFQHKVGILWSIRKAWPEPLQTTSLAKAVVIQILQDRNINMPWTDICCPV